MAVKPIPEGYHTVTPYLLVKGVAQLVEFCKQAFGAQEVARHLHPDGTVGHAEIEIGSSMVMMGEARDEWPARPSCIYMYVPDTDAIFAQAIKAGATSLSEPTDQFYGDRSGGVIDPAGNYWWISTHIEDVSPEEIYAPSSRSAGEEGLRLEEKGETMGVRSRRTWTAEHRCGWMLYDSMVDQMAFDWLAIKSPA